MKSFPEYLQYVFQKMDQSRPLFVYFCPFLIKISIVQIKKVLDSF